MIIAIFTCKYKHGLAQNVHFVENISKLFTNLHAFRKLPLFKYNQYYVK